MRLWNLGCSQPAASNELFKVLLRVRPADVQEAARSLARQGERYVKKARQGASGLDPEIREQVLDQLK